MRSSAQRSTSLPVFDFDGVLVDSKENVFEAYRRVGVQMPEDAWGKAWWEWLPQMVGSDETAMQLHNAKILAYGNLPFTLLPAAKTFWRIVKAGLDAYLLTGASYDVVKRFLVQQEIPATVGNLTIMTSASVETKRRTIELLSPSMYDEIVYVDDDKVAGDNIVSANSIARLVHYTRQSDSELVDLIWGR